MFVRQERNTLPVSQGYDGKGRLQDFRTECVQLNSKPRKELNLIYTKEEKEEEEEENLGSRIELTTCLIYWYK